MTTKEKIEMICELDCRTEEELERDYADLIEEYKEDGEEIDCTYTEYIEDRYNDVVNCF